MRRRTFIVSSLAAAAVTALRPSTSAAQSPAPITRRIPSSGEAIPVIGLGTWITFNVGNDPKLRAECTRVMEAFFAGGGRMVDCSPMYGSSQPVIGEGLKKLGHPAALFSAEKVWTSSASDGVAQIERSRNFWGVPRFDLVQVHNLLAWEAHLKTLAQMKADKKIRYVGITTSEGRRHDLLEEIMKRAPAPVERQSGGAGASQIDFVQLTYNIVDREVESRLLPLAAERGIGVIVNRPFQEGALTKRLARKPLPSFAAEIGATSWAQFILKFIVSHPAVTVVIPATTRVDHVRENLLAASGPLPDAAMRERMAAYVKTL
jgi:diketogulonate reductase-like aldo/keto reductase